MELQIRSNNWIIEELAARSSGYGFCEARWFSPTEYIYICLDKTGKVYQVDTALSFKGPALARCEGEHRGSCDDQEMMFVRSNGLKYLYQSDLRPIPRNKIQTFTKENAILEEQIGREYALRLGVEYLPAKKYKNDGGVRPKKPLIIHRYPDLSGKLWHYNNTVCLRFSPKVWTYFLEGDDGSLTPLFGCTSVLKIVDKSAALIGWSTRLFLEKAIELSHQFRRGDFIEAEWTDYVSMLTYSKTTHQRTLEAAGATGHSAHSFVESLVKATMAGNEPRRLEVLSHFPEDERATNAAVAAVAFFAEHSAKFLASEQRVMSREWMVAGTLDGRILLDNCDRVECPCQEYAPFKSKHLVLDMKTSNQVVNTYFGQVGIYRKCHEEEFPDALPLEGAVILRMGKDDESEFEPFFSVGDDAYKRDLLLFKRCLDLTQSVNEVTEMMRSVKEVRREKIKAAKAAEKLAQDKIRCPKADDYKGARRSKCLPDGTQCEACAKIYIEKHNQK